MDGGGGGIRNAVVTFGTCVTMQVFFCISFRFRHVVNIGGHFLLIA